MTMTATEKTTTRAFPDKKGSDRVWEDCWKCGGEGWIPGLEHVESGRCFECQGAKGSMVLVSSIRAREARERKAVEKRDAIRVAKKAWFEANAALITRLDELGQEDLLEWLHFEVEQPNEKITAVLQARIVRAEAEVAAKAAAEPVPTVEGRIKITGKILGFSWKADTYSYSGREIRKAVIQDDRGFKVYGTATEAFGEKGDRVEFMAEVERSKDDDKFGFFKRPTRVVVVTNNDSEE